MERCPYSSVLRMMNSVRPCESRTVLRVNELWVWLHRGDIFGDEESMGWRSREKALVEGTALPREPLANPDVTTSVSLFIK